VTGGNILTAGVVSAVGNVTGNFLFGNGSQLTGMYGNANVVANLAALSSNPVSTTGNVSGGNVLTTGVVSATGNLQAGNLRTTGLISATGNITAGNVSATGISGTLTTAAQNNITSTGTLSSLTVSGNINMTASSNSFLKLPTAAVDPTGASAGAIYWNTTGAGNLKVYNGSSWITVT
jgi:hypothetical protein